jgi:hypothetical protein
LSLHASAAILGHEGKKDYASGRRGTSSSFIRLTLN